MCNLLIPRPVFQCEFDDGVHFAIRLTIFVNFTKCAIYIPPGPDSFPFARENRKQYYNVIWFWIQPFVFFVVSYLIYLLLLIQTLYSFLFSLTMWIRLTVLIKQLSQASWSSTWSSVACLFRDYTKVKWKCSFQPI